MNDIHQSFAGYGLVRPQQGRVLGGVCAGLGQRFGIAPWTARLLFVLLLMVIPGSQILGRVRTSTTSRAGRGSATSGAPEFYSRPGLRSS